MKLNGIKITWLGHATFRIQTPKGKVVLIDPWVKGNPACPEKEKEVKKSKKKDKDEEEDEDDDEDEDEEDEKDEKKGRPAKFQTKKR